MSSVATFRPSAGTGRPRPLRCLVCDRDLADSELAMCQDVHAACPAQPEVTFLEKVRSAAPATGWSDGHLPADLVCPRCAALINDIVIYESRLADMVQQLVAMVTNTTQSRDAAAAAAAAPSSADKPRARRPRKTPPKKNKPAEPCASSQETDTAGEPDQQRKVRVASLDDIVETEDVDDPTAFAGCPDTEEILGLPSPDAPKTQTDCTWMVSTELVERRRRGRPLSRSTGPHTCSICHKHLASSSSLNKHLQLHTNERRFKCNTCDKAFMDRRALQRHEVDHTGVRPFCCSTCGKTLLSSHALRIHQRGHLGIKPVECNVCGKKMSSAQMLREHLRIHTGERPFSCEVCGRTFRTERILTSHQRTHTGVRPHVCDVCGRAFSQRTPLTAHLRSHTPEQLEAVRRERIGRTAIRTAEGIFDAKDGRSVQPLSVPGTGEGKDNQQQQQPQQQQQAVCLPASVSPAPTAAVKVKTSSASGSTMSGSTDAGLTLDPLVLVYRAVTDGGTDGGTGGDSGDSGRGGGGAGGGSGGGSVDFVGP